MRSRLAALLLLVPVLGAVLYWQLRHPLATAPDTAPAAARREPAPALEFPGAATGAEMAARLDSVYRLPLDRRVVMAARDMRTVISGAPVAPVRVVWNAGRWSLLDTGPSASELPALPAFAELASALEQRAARLLAPSPLAVGAPDGGVTGFLNDALPEEALRQLDRIVARSGPTVASLAQALEACAQLAVLYADDRTQFSDPIAARGLALLGLVRAAGGGPHAREACALAWGMGYRADARAAARALPATDPLRSLVLGGALEATVPATREAKLYRLLRLAHRNDARAWEAAASAIAGPTERGAGNVLATILGFSRFDMNADMPHHLLRASLLDVPGAPVRPRPDAATLEAFERSQASPEFGRPGRISGEALPGARRALFYSGLLAEHEFLADRLASIEAVVEMNHALLPGSTRAGGWFVRWQDHLARAAADQADPSELLADVGDAEIPPPLALLSYEALVERQPPSSMAVRAAARSLATRLDTRPEWSYRFALVAQEALAWPSLSERLLAHAVRGASAEQPTAALLLAHMRGDLPALAAIVDDPATEPEIAVRALRTWVANDSGSAAALLPRFASLSARAPAAFDVMDAHADLLEARGRFADAERVVRRWTICADSTQDALDSTLAITAIARLQRKQGRLRDAAQTAEWLGCTMQNGAMAERSRIAVLSGRFDDGLAIAQAAHERYPDSEAARVLPLELDWLAGRYDDAARLLAGESSDSLYDNAEVAEAFAGVFGRRHDEALKALAAARIAGPTLLYRVWWIAREYERAGDVAFAARLARESGPGSGAKRGFGAAEVYTLLAKAGEDSAAGAWLDRQKMDGAARELLEGLLLTGGHPATAYRLAMADANASNPYAFIIAAAAWRLDGARRTEWRDAIRAGLAPVTDERRRELARFLLGEQSEQGVMRYATDANARAEVWFSCALRAWGEGRVNDMLAWMQLVQETGATSSGEYIWTSVRLLDWATDWRATAKLALGGRRPA